MSGMALINILLARPISLNTLPLSLDIAIKLPYLFSHKYSWIRKFVHSSWLVIDTTCRNNSLNNLLSVRLGKRRHHINPCLCICTRQRCIIIFGQSSLITLMTCGLPSLTQLAGYRPAFCSDSIKRLTWKDEFSAMPYLPAIILWKEASMTAKIPVRPIKKVPSIMICLTYCKSVLTTRGWSSQ